MAEVVDKNCKIVVCSGESFSENKGFALSVLHKKFKIPEVCGSTEPKAIPSPVWIRELNYVDDIDFHVVTVFGANTGKRQEFLDTLKDHSDRYLTIFRLQKLTASLSKKKK